jgi:cell division protein FtsL
MNTATRVLSRHQPATLSSIKFDFISTVLTVIVVISAFAVVYVTDLNRRLFIQYQDAQSTSNQLYIDWGKLLLEQSTWSTQARVQSIAQARLGMEVPASNQIVIVQAS